MKNTKEQNELYNCPKSEFHALLLAKLRKDVVDLPDPEQDEPVDSESVHTAPASDEGFPRDAASLVAPPTNVEDLPMEDARSNTDPDWVCSDADSDWVCIDY